MDVWRSGIVDEGYDNLLGTRALSYREGYDIRGMLRVFDAAGGPTWTDADESIAKLLTQAVGFNTGAELDGLAAMGHVFAVALEMRTLSITTPCYV